MNENNLKGEKKQESILAEESVIETTELVQPKRKKFTFIIGIIIIVLLISTLGVFGGGLFFKVVSRANTSVNNTEISARYDEDSIAYIPTMNGNVIKINDDVNKAVMTSNRTYVVVLTYKNELYFVDLKTNEKIFVADNAFEMGNIHDKGFIYWDSDDVCHRVIYKDCSDVKLGQVRQYGKYIVSSDKNFNITFVVDDALYLMKESSQEKEKLARLYDTCDILYIADDGETVYWCEYGKSENVVYEYYNGEKTKIGMMEIMDEYVSYNNNMFVHNKSGEFGVIVNNTANTLYMVKKGKEPIKVKLNDSLYNMKKIYSVNGELSREKSPSVKGIYVLEKGQSINNLYYIDSEGESEKVLSNITDYEISDGYIYYIDYEDNLKEARINGATVSHEKKISSDVDVFKHYAGYVYFMKDTSKNHQMGSLYVYKQGSEAKRITDDVYCFVSTDGQAEWSGFIGIDGKSCYYLKEPEVRYEVPVVGDLYKYTYGKTKNSRIASDVIGYTISSKNDMNLINNDSFIYERNVSQDEFGYYIGDCYFYNGKDNTLMAEGVCDISPWYKH